MNIIIDPENPRHASVTIKPPVDLSYIKVSKKVACFFLTHLSLYSRATMPDYHDMRIALSMAGIPPYDELRSEDRCRAELVEFLKQVVDRLEEKAE